jgi:hypothetical protein
MSEPRRLLDEGGSDLERRLLRSAYDDAPSAEGRRRTLIALGLVGGAGATVTTTAAAATASTTLLKSSATVVMLKWIGAGVIGGLVTVGAFTAVDVAREPSDPPARVAAKGHAPEAERRMAAVTAAAHEAEAPAPPPAAIPTGDPKPEPARAPAKASASALPERAGPASLTDEVASLDAAQKALDGGDASGALRALDDHDRRFPGGALGPESTRLRVEALAHRGDRAAAARLGEAYLAAHPRSPYASRIRSLIGVPPESAP